MKILSDEQYRVFAIIALCNDSGYNPTAEQVMMWHDNPTPNEATYRDAGGHVVSASSLTYLPALGVDPGPPGLARVPRNIPSVNGTLRDPMTAIHLAPEALPNADLPPVC
ncbi:hypothetical protein [Mycobacterium marinum]|uniref:hypothetical protein n=1 Tax=Mycobacterium marinum TaxID=1781 RepID=UPI000E28C292|nr:hypothetical protein [Mycobacterium marinum]WOR02927.1 hypothetical protein QDR78_17065 [Mycobacterium marinum]